MKSPDEKAEKEIKCDYLVDREYYECYESTVDSMEWQWSELNILYLY